MKRTLRFQNQTYQVTRLYSSGVGENFVAQAAPNGAPTPVKDPGLLEACRAAFGNATVFNGPPNWSEELNAAEKTIPGPNPVRK